MHLIQPREDLWVNTDTITHIFVDRKWVCVGFVGGTSVTVSLHESQEEAILTATEIANSIINQPRRSRSSTGPL